MPHLRIQYVLIAIIAAVFAFLPFIAPEKFSSKTVEKWITTGATVSLYDDFLISEAPKFLSNTAYAGRININGPLRQDVANIYVVSRHTLKKTFPKAVCNCRYLGRHDTIVCDADFLPQFTSFMNTSTEEFGEEQAKTGLAAERISGIVNSLYGRFLRAWLIGHEIGHLVLGYDAAALHSPEAQGSSVSTGEAALEGVGMWGSKVEREADLFMISRISHEPQLQVSIWLGLSQFVTSMYHDLILAQVSREEIERLVDQGVHPIFSARFDVSLPMRPDRHPPWLIRALDLADTLLVAYPKMIDESGYFERVRQRLKPKISDTTDPFCHEETGAEGQAPTPATAAANEIRYIERLISIGRADLTHRRLRALREKPGMLPQDDPKLLLYVDLLALEAKAAVDPDLDLLAALADLRRRHPPEAASDFENMIYLALLEAKGLRRSGISEDLGERFHSVLSDIGAQAQTRFRTPEYGDDIDRFYLESWRLFKEVHGTESEIATSYIEALGEVSVDPHIASIVAEEIERDALVLLSFSHDNLAATVDWLISVRDFYEQQGRLAESAAVGKAIIRLGDAIAEPRYPFGAFYRDLVGRTLVRLGTAMDAVPLMREGVKVRRSIWQLAKEVSPEHEEKAREQFALALNNFGFALLHTFDAELVEEAVPILEEALKLRDSMLTPNEVEIATIKHNLAQAYVGVGKGADALPLVKKAIELRSRLFGENHLLTANSRAVLFGAYVLVGDMETAREEYQRLRTAMSVAFDFDVFLGSHVFLNGEPRRFSELIGAPEEETGDIAFFRVAEGPRQRLQDSLATSVWESFHAPDH